MRRRNAQLLRHDAAWALFWLLFSLSGFVKWAVRREWPPLGDAAGMLAYMAWSPLIVFLTQRRRALGLGAQAAAAGCGWGGALQQRRLLWSARSAAPPGGAHALTAPSEPHNSSPNCWRCCRAAWYVRHRNALLVTMRLTRTFSRACALAACRCRCQRIRPLSRPPPAMLHSAHSSCIAAAAARPPPSAKACCRATPAAWLQ